MNTLIAYHNDPAVKREYLARVEAHRQADELVQGYGYWMDGKGCAVGCTIHGASHSKYESELGIPRVLAHLEDKMFEGMPTENARLWPERFLDAIPVGADLTLVWPRFAVWLLTDPEHGVVKYATERGAIAINHVAELYQQTIEGKPVTRDQWIEARKNAAAAYADAYAAAAAYDAAYDAAAAAYDAASAYAYADAADYAADAAYAYADAYADAYAADAADAYADAYAAASAARRQSFVRQSEKLLELLAAAPVIEMEVTP